MDFDFSDDQQQLRDAVAKWVEKGYTFERRRSITAAGGFSREAYNELAELGLAGLYVSEDDGGLGMGPVEGMVVMEQLGRGMVLEPLAQTLVCSGVIGAYAGADVKAAWLPGMASGDKLVVLAHQERKARYRSDLCDTVATPAGGGWTLSGTKHVVPAGDQADAFVVPAMANGRLALFVVERSAAGVSTRGYLTQDGGRAADLSLAHSPATLITTDGIADSDKVYGPMLPTPHLLRCPYLMQVLDSIGEQLERQRVVSTPRVRVLESGTVRAQSAEAISVVDVSTIRSDNVQFGTKFAMTSRPNTLVNTGRTSWSGAKHTPANPWWPTSSAAPLSARNWRSRTPAPSPATTIFWTVCCASMV